MRDGMARARRYAARYVTHPPKAKAPKPNLHHTKKPNPSHPATQNSRPTERRGSRRGRTSVLSVSPDARPRKAAHARTGRPAPAHSPLLHTIYQTTLLDT